MATKKLPRFANDVDRKVAKEVVHDFLKLILDEAGAKMPPEARGAERQSYALALIEPSMRAALVEFWTRNRYGKPTRQSTKARQTANTGAETRP